jgi:pimeloyl-ACP methyl ester carboxylesterase
MGRPLQPDQLYPAGVAGVSARFITLSTGVRVRVAERGPPDGRPVLMLHGWGASLYMYRHAFDMLPPHGVRAIAVDLRGYGLSDKPRDTGSYSLDAYIQDLHALLEALGLPRVVLIGQSMGGGLALRYTLRHPERVSRLVLINPTALVSVAYATILSGAPRAVVRALHTRLVPRWLIAFILRRIAFRHAARVTRRDVDEYWAATQLDGFMDAAHGGLAEFDWRPVSDAEAAALSVPTLVILGSRDRLVRNARRRAERLNGAVVKVLEGGHSVNEEFPDEVYGLVSDFIR